MDLTWNCSNQFIGLIFIPWIQENVNLLKTICETTSVKSITLNFCQKRVLVYDTAWHIEVSNVIQIRLRLPKTISTSKNPKQHNSSDFFNFLVLGNSLTVLAKSQNLFLIYWYLEIYSQGKMVQIYQKSIRLHIEWFAVTLFIH